MDKEAPFEKKNDSEIAALLRTPQARAAFEKLNTLNPHWTLSAQSKSFELRASLTLKVKGNDPELLSGKSNTLDGAAVEMFEKVRAGDVIIKRSKSALQEYSLDLSNDADKPFKLVMSYPLQ